MFNLVISHLVLMTWDNGIVEVEGLNFKILEDFIVEVMGLLVEGR